MTQPKLRHEHSDPDPLFAVSHAADLLAWWR